MDNINNSNNDLHPSTVSDAVFVTNEVVATPLLLDSATARFGYTAAEPSSNFGYTAAQPSSNFHELDVYTSETSPAGKEFPPHTVRVFSPGGTSDEYNRTSAATMELDESKF